MEITPGKKSTEFYLTLFAQLVAIAVLFGVMTAEQAESVAAAVESTARAVTALVISLVPMWQYIKSRTAIKTAPK